MPQILTWMQAAALTTDTMRGFSSSISSRHQHGPSAMSGSLAHSQPQQLCRPSASAWSQVVTHATKAREAEQIASIHLDLGLHGPQTPTSGGNADHNSPSRSPVHKVNFSLSQPLPLPKARGIPRQQGWGLRLCLHQLQAGAHHPINPALLGKDSV